MESHILAVLWACMLYGQGLTDAQFTCYSCSYTRSSAPEVGYECVTSPANVSRGQPAMTCQVPNMCVTKASVCVGSNCDGGNHIRSLLRACLPQGADCSGDTCCNDAGLYPACEQKCRTDLCNDLNGDVWIPENAKPGTNDGGNGAAKHTNGVSAMLLIIFSTILLLNTLT